MKIIASMSAIVLLVAILNVTTAQRDTSVSSLGAPCDVFTPGQNTPENSATSDRQNADIANSDNRTPEEQPAVRVNDLSENKSAPLMMSEISENLYVVTGDGGNVAIQVTTEGAVLVDNKFSRNHDKLTACVARVTNLPIKYMIGTHHHADHMGGNPSLSTETLIVAHDNARANMIAGNQPAPPAVVFSSKTSLFLGDSTIDIHHFGNGHTNGDSVVLFTEHRVLHTGDLFVEGLPFIDYANGGNSADWVDTLGGILTLDFDTVVPGHGPILVKRDLQTFRDRLITLRIRTLQLIQRGLTQQQTLAQLETTDLGWTLTSGSLFVRRSFPDFYKELLDEL